MIGKIISKIWLSSAGPFDLVQHLFNGTFWEEFLRRFDSYTKGRVIDLACGTGELADHIRPQSYLGIDMNEKYIQYAKNHRKQGSFIVGDITKLFLKGSFDTAVIVSATHHLNEKQIHNLCQSVIKLKPKKILVVDGLPKKPFSDVLKYLDAKLGGGNFFRNENILVKIFAKYFSIIEKGSFKARRSFYYYPYLVATTTRP